MVLVAIPRKLPVWFISGKYPMHTVQSRQDYGLFKTGGHLLSQVEEHSGFLFQI
jgi:hypothetical protein